MAVQNYEPQFGEYTNVFLASLTPEIFCTAMAVEECFLQRGDRRDGSSRGKYIHPESSLHHPHSLLLLNKTNPVYELLENIPNTIAQAPASSG